MIMCIFDLKEKDVIQIRRRREVYSDTQSGKVFDYIISNIRSGTWPVGSQIFTEAQFCEELNVSRIGVREALERCAALGIVEKRKGAGTFVKKIDFSSIMSLMGPLMSLTVLDVEEIMDFRVHFETGNVMDFIRCANESDYEKLRNSYRNMQETIGDAVAFPDWDHTFHTIIAEGTHNPITSFVNSLLNDILASAYNMAIEVIGPYVGLEYHKLILDAIEKKDVQLSSLLMQRHIEESRRILLEAMEKDSDSFDLDR